MYVGVLTGTRSYNNQTCNVVKKQTKSVPVDLDIAWENSFKLRTDLFSFLPTREWIYTSSSHVSVAIEN